MLHAFWSFFLRAHTTDTIAHRDADSLAALALLGPARPPGWRRWLRAGGLTLPFRMGLRSHQALQRLDRQLAPLLSDPALPDDTRWLDVIAVRPDLQGHGLGSELLAHCLQTDTPWALLTSPPPRLAWYTRFGFAPVAERHIDEGVTSWLLLRPAGACGASPPSA